MRGKGVGVTRSIGNSSGSTYKEQVDLLNEEITLAELEVYDSRLEELNLEAALNFATNAHRKVIKGNLRIVIGRLTDALQRLFPFKSDTFSSPYIAATHELRPRQWLNLSRIEEQI